MHIFTACSYMTPLNEILCFIHLPHLIVHNIFKTHYKFYYKLFLTAILADNPLKCLSHYISL
ncbi:unnamed protein product [Bubo scandiacus]